VTILGHSGDGAAFQQTQFRIGDERVESVRKQLTIETNFSLKIPDPIRLRSTLEELRVIVYMAICGMRSLLAFGMIRILEMSRRSMRVRLSPKQVL
jgi:hypothetical protein